MVQRVTAVRPSTLVSAIARPTSSVWGGAAIVYALGPAYTCRTPDLCLESKYLLKPYIQIGQFSEGVLWDVQGILPTHGPDLEQLLDTSTHIPAASQWSCS